MFIASAYGEVILYKLHCKDSVSVHRLLAYSSVSIKMLPKASGRITVRLQGVQANGPGGTQGKRRGRILIDCSHGARPCPKHFMWISHFILVIAQWRNDSHSIFSSSCGCTLKSSTRQHSWAWPRFRLCLWYLRAMVPLIGFGLWARVTGLLPKLTPVFLGVRGQRGSPWLPLRLYGGGGTQNHENSIGRNCKGYPV